MATESEDNEAVDITTRDGAIWTLREMRKATTRIMTSDPHPELDLQLAEIFAQLYGITIILGGILGDPDLATEMESQSEQVDQALAEAIESLNKEAPGDRN